MLGQEPKTKVNNLRHALFLERTVASIRNYHACTLYGLVE
jgi:hypothetical protein